MRVIPMRHIHVRPPGHTWESTSILARLQSAMLARIALKLDRSVTSLDCEQSENGRLSRMRWTDAGERATDADLTAPFGG